jgi:hypothetical protein
LEQDQILLSALPTDILLAISYFLDYRSLCYLEQTGRRFSALLASESFDIGFWRYQFSLLCPDGLNDTNERINPKISHRLASQACSWKEAFEAVLSLQGSISLQSPQGESLRFICENLYRSDQRKCAIVHRSGGREKLHPLSIEEAKNIWKQVDTLHIVEILSKDFSPEGGTRKRYSTRKLC